MQGTDPRQLRTPARVLTVLGQPVLAEVVRLALSHGQFQTRIAADEAEATAIIGEWQPHLAIIDMDVSKGELLDRLSAAPTPVGRIPVIALTRRGDLQTKLAAFDRGVDDILVVPFSPEELVARTLAIMRRTYQETIAFTPVIRLGELEVDILHRRVRSGSIELHLTSLEQSLLYLLAANAGRLVTREQILDNLWGVDYAAESNVVDRHVRNLRTKLHDDWRRPRFIATVPGRGYRFLPALTPATA
jgi:DNA-binding response OmpR family regulator